MISPGTEVRLTGSSFLPFNKNGCSVSLFPVTGDFHPTAMTFEMSWTVAWHLHQPIPSGLIRFHRLRHVISSGGIFHLECWNACFRSYEDKSFLSLAPPPSLIKQITQRKVKQEKIC